MKNLALLFLMILPFLFIGCGDDSESTADTFIDSRDQHEYKYVTIGTQTWMAENLAYLPAVSQPESGSVEVLLYYVYLYDEDEGTVEEAKATTNYKKYGVLYNWPAAMAACPDGWHLPADQEWKVLETYLGMNQADVDTLSAWRKSGSVAKALKYTSGWYLNGSGKNSSGFTALPGGLRDNDDGFSTLGYNAWFWTATKAGSTHAWYRDLYSSYEGVWRATESQRQGYSVRCLRD